MTSVRAKIRSTQLEENVSIRVIQYIPACLTHKYTQSHIISPCCYPRVRLEVPYLCDTRQSQEEDHRTYGEGDKNTLGFGDFGEGITNAGDDHFYGSEEEQ